MEINVDDPEEILKIAEALSSITRINILKILNESPKSITELSEELKMTKGNISNQVALLENAGLVDIEYQNGVKGIKKIIKTKYNRIIISLDISSSPKEANK
ncbi:ArsR/SmtB family transcription factor [Acidianus brierleyi]|uniref:Transcriptional regulator n=1 Tax=Acidianus brierleyi TaxID=41673 RepID=A0A2U9IE87_9CREN|nr:winged helix-turn-helix domain-containing protein [Acidianus brierleyi]AWR94353.1 ArsR family transcriptional regulator [Acidianus brierleyi]